MADIADIATQIENENRTKAIEHAKQNREQPNVINGETLCLDCDDIVLQIRVDSVNAVRCIDCQTFKEIKTSQGR